MDTLSLVIVGPMLSRKIEVEWVEIESTTGSFTVTPGHIPLVSIIKNKAGICFKEKNKEPERIVVSQGIALVDQSMVRLLLERS